METNKIEIECYDLYDVLEYIKCEDVDDNFRNMRDYYCNNMSFPIIYFRHVEEFLDEGFVSYSVDEDEDYKLWSTPISIIW